MVVRVTTSGDIDEARTAAERLARERGKVPEESTTPDLVGGWAWFTEAR
jgi:hypothetical protein